MRINNAVSGWIETRSLPTLTRSYPRRFTFYVADPISFILFASDYRAVPSGASRTNRTWEICHLVRPIPGVESEGRHESVAGAPHNCGFDDAEALAWRKIRVWRGAACLVCLVCERALL